jgi:hypothetical protein
MVGCFTQSNGILKVNGLLPSGFTSNVGFGSLSFTSYTNNNCPLSCVLDTDSGRNILYVGGSFRTFSTNVGGSNTANSLVAFVMKDNTGTTRNVWARVGYSGSNNGTTSPVYHLYKSIYTETINVSGLFGTTDSGTSGGAFGNTNIRSFFTFNYAYATYASNFITTYIENTYTMSLSLPNNTNGFFVSIYNSGDGNFYFAGNNLTNLYQYSTSDSTTVYNNLNGLCRSNIYNNNLNYNTTTSQNEPPVKNFNTSYINNVI